MGQWLIVTPTNGETLGRKRHRMRRDCEGISGAVTWRGGGIVIPFSAPIMDIDCKAMKTGCNLWASSRALSGDEVMVGSDLGYGNEE